MCHYLLEVITPLQSVGSQGRQPGRRGELQDQISVACLLYVHYPVCLGDGRRGDEHYSRNLKGIGAAPFHACKRMRIAASAQPHTKKSSSKPNANSAHCLGSTPAGCVAAPQWPGCSQCTLTPARAAGPCTHSRAPCPGSSTSGRPSHQGGPLSPANLSWRTQPHPRVDCPVSIGSSPTGRQAGHPPLPPTHDARSASAASLAPKKTVASAISPASSSGSTWSSSCSAQREL